MKHDTAIPASRRVYIDFLKVIAIYLVLFNHTGVSGFVLFTVRQGTKMYFPLMFNAILIKIAVPLFFMASGALLLGKEESYGDLLCKRFLRFLVVLVVASLISYLYTCLRQGSQALSAAYFWTMLYTHNLAGSYWYLYAYLAYILMLPLLRKLAKAMTAREYRWMFLMYGIINCLQIVEYLIWKGEKSHNRHFSFFIITSYVFYPLMGYYIDRCMKDAEFTVRRLLAMTAVSVAAIVVCCLMTHYSCTLTGGWDEESCQTFFSTLIFLPTVTVYYGVKLLFLRHPPTERLKKIIVAASETTFGLYLINHICLEETIPVFAALYPHMRVLIACWIWTLCACLLGGGITFLVKKIPGVRKFL